MQKRRRSSKTRSYHRRIDIRITLQLGVEAKSEPALCSGFRSSAWRELQVALLCFTVEKRRKNKKQV